MFTVFSKEKNQEKEGRFFLLETKDKAPHPHEELKNILEVPPKKLNPEDLNRLTPLIVDWRSGDLELEKEIEVVTPTPLLIEPSKNDIRDVGSTADFADLSDFAVFFDSYLILL